MLSQICAIGAHRDASPPTHHHHCLLPETPSCLLGPFASTIDLWVLMTLMPPLGKQYCQEDRSPSADSDAEFLL